MRLFTKMILAAMLAIAWVPAATAATTTLNVHVRNEVGVALGSVTVAAIQFGMNGPSTHTVIAQTNDSGNAVFTIEQQMSYNIMVSSHGFSPTVADQFNNPEYDPSRYVWAMNGNTVYSTFTLTNDLTEVVRIKLEIANATPNTVLFGGLHNMLAQQPGGSGIVRTDGSGAGFLIVDNVPYTETSNVYNIGLYDPYLNRGTGRNIMSILNGSLPLVDGARMLSYTGAAKADFNNSIPPSRVENNTSGSAAVSTSAVQGIVRSTGTTLWSAIGHIGVNYQSCSDFKWANVDENGRFQLTDLTLGATYYAKSMGGCSWRQGGGGTCYEPYTSPALTGVQDLCSGLAPRGENDFVYVSSALPIFQGVASPGYYDTLKVQLNEMAASTGTFKVCAKSPSGAPIPNSQVNINPDGSPWSDAPNACAGTNYPDFQQRPGYAIKNLQTGADGCVTLTGIPSGNYVVNVWTQFSGGMSVPFNAGPDRLSPAWGMNQDCHDQTCWLQTHCAYGGTGVDDYRVLVETNTAEGDNQMLHVYDSSGALVTDGAVNLSSITYVVTAGGNSSGLVRGTLQFPGVTDLSVHPITIALYPDCRDGMSCGSGNFASVSGSGADHYDYQINVSSGFSYYMYTSAYGWGRIRRGGGNDQIHLGSTGTVVVDMDFEPAGIVTGTLYKPDGTVFIPADDQYVWLDFNNDNGGSGTQLQKDGTFTLTSVLPGINRIRVNGSGETSFDYALPSPAPSVTVIAGSTSTVNVNLVNATYVGIGFNPALTPDTSVRISTGNGDTVIGFKVIPLPAGTLLKGETIMNMLASKDDQLKFRYSTGTVPGDESGSCGGGQPPGFCALAIPSPSVYDFYLMRSGDFGDMSAGPQLDMPYPHFSLLTSSKNVVLDSSRANTLMRPAYSMSYATGVPVNLNPPVSMAARGNATITGHVVANNFFRQSDYDACGGDFEAFLRYLPVVTLYDANGTFKAAGLVVPPMEFISQKEQTGAFMGTFSQGYAQFRDMLAEAPYYAYEIRGVAPSACYTAVVTTPNYPPYQTRTCLGVNGSTTTVNINLDNAVGAGATLTGVVTTTNTAVRLSNVAVSLVGEGIDPRSVVTDSTGVYKFEGLPPGEVRLKVSAEGYALADAEKELVGSNIYTQNFALTAAGGSVSGTVYSQKLPYAKVQPGALIYAYNDTYNGTHPTAPLPLIKTRTGSDGTYRLTGLIPTDVYKVFLKVPGKYTLNQTFSATNGLTTGIDFIMKPKPLDIEVFAKKGDEYYEFTVLNPSDFKSGNVIYGPSPLNPANVSTVTLTQLNSGELHGKIPLSSLTNGVTYVLQGAAVSYSGKSVVRELLFGKSYKGNAEQQIDDLIIGDDTEDEKGRKGNEAAMDQSGDDASAIMFPPGAVLPVSTGAVPTCSFKGEDKSDASVADKVNALGSDAFAGNLYTVELTSVTPNEDKSIELTLAYDKTTADLTDLSVARYNDTTSKWEEVTGIATVNPVKGTVKVKLKSLASILAKPGSVQVNSFDGRQYVVRPQAAGGGGTSGTFAVIRPSVAGDAYGGTKLKVFNYPNPFSLKAKTVTAHNHDAGNLASLTTNGTFIHLEVPAANGGPCHIRIYTLAGELVNDLSSTCVGGKYNYFEWNGHNKAGQEVANGVYYGVVELSGKKPSRENATFKMAVIK